MKEYVSVVMDRICIRKMDAGFFLMRRNVIETRFLVSFLLAPLVFFIDALMGYFGISGNISISSMFYAVLTVIFTVYIIFKILMTQSIRGGYLTPFFGVMILLSTYALKKTGWNFEHVLRDFILLIFYFVVSIVFAGKINNILNRLVVLNVFQVVIVFQLLISLLEINFPVFIANNIEFDRLTNVFAHPNVFAMFLLVQIILLLYFIEAKLGNKKILYSFLVLLCVNVVLTKSLTAIFILIVIVCYEIVKTKSAAKISAMLMMMVFIIMFMSMTVFSERYIELIQLSDAIIHQDLSKMNYGSLYWRLLIWKDSISYFYDSPYFGYGIGTYPYVTGVGNLAHNDYIRFLIEGGFVGFIVYLICLGGLLVKNHRVKSDMLYSSLVLKLLIVLIISSFSLNIFNYTPVMTMFVILLSGYAKVVKV